MSDEPKPTFITVTAPYQQETELQVLAICVEALRRLNHPQAQKRVVAYLLDRAGVDMEAQP